MKKKKAIKPDAVTVEIWKMLGDVNTDWLKDPFNKVFVDGKML